MQQSRFEFHDTVADKLDRTSERAHDKAGVRPKRVRFSGKDDGWLELEGRPNAIHEIAGHLPELESITAERIYEVSGVITVRYAAAGSRWTSDSE